MYYDIKCETCDREFGSQQAAIQHMDALDHWAQRFGCERCDREFSTQLSADQHMDDTGHREPQFGCDTCNKRFHTRLSANQHMEARNHHKQYCCHECSTSYKYENALRMHLNSSIHRGKNVACPFCKAALASASGLSHHLETGSCPRAKNVNYRTIFQAISQRDPNRILTNKLLTYSGSDRENIATSASWNGSSFECYLCHREYDSIRALNQHLSSPAHSEKLYHCPNRSCKGQFVRLASLFNHLESESCNFVRFERVQKHVHTFITGQKLLDFA